MSTTTYPMTQEGLNVLQAELNRLKHTERPRIIKAIADAREHGDLKENAEYHAAREEQSFNEGRIQELETKLSYTHVIDVARLPQDHKVVFGVTVHVRNLSTDEAMVYKIVGEDEADLKLGKVSYRSPLARALIGRHVGETAPVQTPAGLVEYEIEQILYQ